MTNKFKKIFAVKVEFEGSELRFVKARNKAEARRRASDSWIGITGTTQDTITSMPKTERITTKTFRRLMGNI